MTGPASDQRSYHHGDLQDTLKRLAVADIAANGTEALSLRAIGRAAGVSPAAFYRHFPSRNHLLAAIATDGFAGLAAQVDANLLSLGRNPAARLLGCGRGYIRYALAHPVHYRLMFGGVLTDFSAFAGLRPAAEASYVRLRRVLADGLDDGSFVGGNIDELGGTVWSAVHGIVSLLIDKVGQAELAPDSDVMRAVMAVAGDPEMVLQRLLRGVLAPGVPFPDKQPDKQPEKGRAG